MKESLREDPCCDMHPVLEKVHELYHDLLEHDGFGELRMEMRILRRGQKEVIIHCGKQYRFVVDTPRQGRAARNEIAAVPRSGLGKEVATPEKMAR